VIAAFLAVVDGSCTTPEYLPTHDKIDENQYGSYIEVYLKKGSYVNGELIAIDSNTIFVLPESESNISRGVVEAQISDVHHFLLRYAKPKHYGWAIPLSVLTCITHGYFAVLTLPANLIVTISVAVGGENAFRYNSRTMSFDKLRMFARFPQGIPHDINVALIK